MSDTLKTLTPKYRKLTAATADDVGSLLRQTFTRFGLFATSTATAAQAPAPATASLSKQPSLPSTTASAAHTLPSAAATSSRQPVIPSPTASAAQDTPRALACLTIQPKIRVIQSACFLSRLSSAPTHYRIKHLRSNLSERQYVARTITIHASDRVVLY